MGYRFYLFLSISLVYISCERDFNSYYDTKNEIDIPGFVGMSFNLYDAQYRLNWDNSEKNISHYLIESILQGDTFQFEIEVGRNKFEIDWCDFETLNFYSVADQNISLLKSFINVKPQGFNFLTFENTLQNINPTKFNLEVLFNTYANSYANCNNESASVNSSFYKDLELQIFDDDVQIMSFSKEYFDCDSNIFFNDIIAPNENYKFKVFKTIESKKYLIGSSDVFSLLTHEEYGVSASPNLVKTNAELNLAWTSNLDKKFSSINIYLESISSSESIILAENILDDGNHSFIIPFNILAGAYRIKITSKSGLYFGVSNIFNIVT
tara:strand:+ start:251 stop:1222 length:972 start_codon:yes stop_codon:yes gene_type:complete